MTVPVYNMTDLWNSGGTVFAAIQMNVTNTASAAGSKLLDLQISSASLFSVDKNGAVVAADNINGLSLSLGSGGDAKLFRDAANIFGQRNGANAQAFRVYNTFTDVSNYERFVLDWVSQANNLLIGFERAGTGSPRNIHYINDGGGHVFDSTYGATIGSFNTGGINLANSTSTAYTFDAVISLQRANGRCIKTFTDQNGGTGATFLFPCDTNAQITSNQNNYALTGYSKFQRISSDASRDVTGLTFGSAQGDGQEHVLINVGAQSIVLKHENASSTAANRLHNTTGADITLSADQQAYLIYDGTTARWRVSKMS